MALDGVEVGPSPVLRRHLRHGRHKVVARKPGFADVTVEAEVPAGGGFAFPLPMSRAAVAWVPDLAQQAVEPGYELGAVYFAPGVGLQARR